ncbi:RING/U-box superfamily protein [Prunus dulcis]|uniref:RING/U-box superfamily protein n=1 Tax=Prunus dulcis TaxID=3755 RepID=A0A4Y1RCX6_PRUDU|nr:RING/U-box superfamily protein [Prunus dulcis]
MVDHNVNSHCELSLPCLALCYTTRRISEEPIRCRLVFGLSTLNLPPKFLISLFLRELLPSLTSEEPANQPTGSAQTWLSKTLEPKDLHGLDLRFSNSWRHGPDPNRHSHSLRGQPDIRRAVGAMKEIAVDLERDNQFERVKELENAVIELLGTHEDCSHFSSTIQSVGEKYQPGPELTDFDQLFKNEVAMLKANSSSDPQNHPLMRQFREAVWNVHHSGEPMPGEEQEDIVMTSNQCNILNVTCPLSGKPITELQHPVRSVVCKHVYDKGSIMHYLRSKNTRCPVAACPKLLQADKVVCDPLLLVEIDELRAMKEQTVMTDVIEDFTELDEE